MLARQHPANLDTQPQDVGAERLSTSSSHFGAEAVLVIANPAGLTVSKAVGAAR
jgi:hypothetical protein